jgi:hypothetical protein
MEDKEHLHGILSDLYLFITDDVCKHEVINYFIDTNASETDQLNLLVKFVVDIGGCMYFDAVDLVNEFIVDSNVPSNADLS